MKFVRSFPSLADSACLSWLAVLLLLATATDALAEPDWAALPYTPSRQMQAINADGTSAWSLPTSGADLEQGFKIRGVVLSDPAALYDPSASYVPCGPGTQWQLGGQWQIFVQTVDSTDFGGTALWMGQNYGNHIWHWPDSSYSYSNSEWNTELARLTTNGTLRAGDLVEVRARGGLFYKGKFNVNEEHDKDTAFDFDIEILAHDQMPTPTLLSLADIKQANDAFDFQQDRQSGAEHYQGTLVRFDDVHLVDASAWGTGGMVTITDGTLHLPMKLGCLGFDSIAAPTGTFNVYGIFDQESTDYRNGYYLWVTDASQFAVVAEPGSVIMLIGLGIVLTISQLGLRRRRKDASNVA